MGSEQSGPMRRPAAPPRPPRLTGTPPLLLLSQDNVVRRPEAGIPANIRGRAGWSDDAASAWWRNIAGQPGEPAGSVTPPSRRPAGGSARPPLGAILSERGVVAPGDLARAHALQQREDARLGDILLAHRMIEDDDLADALAAQWRTEETDLAAATPDPRLVDALGVDRCMSLRVLPLRRMGSFALVATSHPDRFAVRQHEIAAALGPVVMTLASETEVVAALERLRGPHLARLAEARTPGALSCRRWNGRRAARLALAAVAAAAAWAVAAPIATLWALTALVVGTLVCTATLKALALGQLFRQIRRRRAGDAAPGPAGSAPRPLRLPTISVLVPLFQEEDVAGSLLARLERLRYPRELTDVILLVEEGDATTVAALRGRTLPRHVRTVTVPPGTVTTKPRALNYGLAFCRGQIVGIWDAEDAPDPDQLHAVAAGFAGSEPRVACLQGALDFYNPRANWLARCFTLEYGTWFRGFLPGLQALDLPIPLGGTTLFFRRSALATLGAWDAHNVTEDADLGIRLYRAGYRTAMIDTTTAEEANCRLVPWIRQRSRWLKGYAITWAVHMRRPGRLWRDMGWRGALGFNVLFVGTLVQFVLQPVLLGFWVLAIGLPHPLSGHVPPALGWALLALFISAEAVSIALTLLANRAPGRRWLWPWIPTLQAYFPLATLAAYKGLSELVARPFYWDKTAHGLHGEEEIPDVARRPAPASLPTPDEAGGDIAQPIAAE